MAAVLPGVGLFAFAGALVQHGCPLGFSPRSMGAGAAETLDEGALHQDQRIISCYTCALLRTKMQHMGPVPGAGRSSITGQRTAFPDLGARGRVAAHDPGPALSDHDREPAWTRSQTRSSRASGLLTNGYIGLGLIVFIASIVVPVAKLIALVVLLRSVERRSAWKPRDRHSHRITEIVGAWSMVDVFLVGLLSGLVSLNLLANIEPGIGATFFGAVVVITMFAAHGFDPRLIWDEAGANEAPAAPEPTTAGALPA